MLRRILQALDAAEVHRRLDRLGVARQPCVPNDGGDGGAFGDGTKGLAETCVRQELRIDALRHVAQLLDRLVDLGTQALQQRAVLGSRQLLFDKREMHPKREQALLRAVVQVALDAPPLGVPRFQDARAGVA